MGTFLRAARSREEGGEARGKVWWYAGLCPWTNKQGRKVYRDGDGVGCEGIGIAGWRKLKWHGVKEEPEPELVPVRLIRWESQGGCGWYGGSTVVVGKFDAPEEIFYICFENVA